MNVWDGYGRANIARNIGSMYIAVLQYKKSESFNKKIRIEKIKYFWIQKDKTVWAILVIIPIDADKEGENIWILDFLDFDVTLF